MSKTFLYRPGEVNISTKPGDFILTHRESFYSWLIDFGQKLRFKKQPSYYTHAAIITGNSGELVEALGTGVKEDNISKYRNVFYTYVEIDAEDKPRQWVKEYAQTMAKRRTSYGWLEILSLGIQILTGLRVALSLDGHMICSGLVATALERTGVIFPRNASCMMPVDLAEFYNVSNK